MGENIAKFISLLVEYDDNLKYLEDELNQIKNLEYQENKEELITK